MPEYLAPGVYVEEVSFRSKSIEGVSTTTTGLIGPARYGPLDQIPDLLTSLADFEATYGDGQQLIYNDTVLDNYLWHAVRAFFEEGGERLYVSRVFSPLANPGTGFAADGCAYAKLPATANDDDALHIRARFPGSVGNMQVRLTVRIGQNVLGFTPGQAAKPRVVSLLPEDIVWARHGTDTSFRLAEQYFNPDPSVQDWTWRFALPAAGGTSATGLELAQLTPNTDLTKSDEVRVVTLTLTVTPNLPNSAPTIWGDLPLDPAHTRDGNADSLTALFAEHPRNPSQASSIPLVITIGKNLATGLDILNALLKANDGLTTALDNFASNDPLIRKKSTEVSRSIDIILSGGNDGQRPGATEYEGTADEESNIKTGLKAFEDIEDISIIAAPGSSYGYEDDYHDDASTIADLLIAHAEQMHYRIAILDCGDGQSIGQIRRMRGRIDSTYAALYYPWIRILDPITRRDLLLPPSGFVAGIYARNDINRGVYKAPANEVVNLALGFEKLLNKSQQDVLNPEGINCFRFFEGRGFRLWGARTVSSDPEWKYVNLRRYFAYLEHSLDKGTQWAVFEPNGEALWTNVRHTVEDFLFNEWKSGALLGDKPEQAYFVRCDRSTMTQNDLDNGRLVCQVGVAALRPAEYVIFRIGQWTGESQS